MIQGMTIGDLKQCIVEAQERGLTDDALVVMYVPLTDGMITPLAYTEHDDLYVAEPNSTTGERLTWDLDTCGDVDLENYVVWRNHAQEVHGGVPCIVVYGMR